MIEFAGSIKDTGDIPFTHTLMKTQIIKNVCSSRTRKRVRLQHTFFIICVFQGGST